MTHRKRFHNEIPSSEITSEAVYRSRREFMKGAAALSMTALLVACGAPDSPPPGTPDPQGLPTPVPTFTPAPDNLTSEPEVLNYNNFYEFSVEKEGIAQLAEGLVTSPWEVAVGGLVAKPGVYDVDDLKRQFDQEERIYRLRCVETWSMVIPWLGFPLRELLEEAEPLPEARYVRFETLYDPQQMPNQQTNWYEWPYVEGLRLDEAMHDLTLLATGLYGKDLQPQNGAPIRLVVPWKYGFKSIKSIVKIALVAEPPTSLWMAASPEEYGFYANVNPKVPHPRWSQATERRIGDMRRRKTLLFNGYEAEVAHLYEGMDLLVNF